MAKSIITPPGIMCFPNLFEARAAVPGQEPRFNLLILIDEAGQRTKEFKELQDEIIAAAHEKFGAKLPSNMRMPVRDAAEKDEYEGFEAGKVFISPWTKQKPGLVDNLNNEIFAKDDIWAGQIVRGYVRPFGYDQSGNKGVGLMLEHVQVLKRDMPRIDGRKSASAAFGATPAEYADSSI
jgi:hypothetical protein